MKQVQSNKRIQKEAAEWVTCVYSGNASAEDEINLSKWLSQSDDHAAEYTRALDMWDVSIDAAPDVVEPSTVFGQTWMKVGSIAAMLVIGFISVWIITSTAPSGDMQSVAMYATAKGQTKDINLTDGSVISMNTDTKLYVDYSDNMRRVILDRGEAFFDVAKNKERPFVISAGNQMVTVLGTKFNVRQKAGELTVAVVEGLVAVHETIETDQLKSQAQNLVLNDTAKLDGFDHVRLQAGSVGVFHKKAELQSDIQTADAESHQNWRQGIVKFSSEPLSVFVQEIARYTDKEIIVADAELLDMKISGVFHYDDIAGIMTGLEVMLPVEIVTKGNVIHIYKKR